LTLGPNQKNIPRKSSKSVKFRAADPHFISPQARRRGIPFPIIYGRLEGMPIGTTERINSSNLLHDFAEVRQTAPPFIEFFLLRGQIILRRSFPVTEPLFLAARAGDLNALMTYERRGANMNSVDPNTGNNLLHVASTPTVTRYLLKLGVDRFHSNRLNELPYQVNNFSLALHPDVSDPIAAIIREESDEWKAIQNERKNERKTERKENPNRDGTDIEKYPNPTLLYLINQAPERGNRRQETISPNTYLAEMSGDIPIAATATGNSLIRLNEWEHIMDRVRYHNDIPLLRHFLLRNRADFPSRSPPHIRNSPGGEFNPTEVNWLGLNLLEDIMFVRPLEIEQQYLPRNNIRTLAEMILRTYPELIAHIQPVVIANLYRHGNEDVVDMLINNNLVIDAPLADPAMDNYIEYLLNRGHVYGARLLLNRGAVFRNEMLTPVGQATLAQVDRMEEQPFRRTKSSAYRGG
jgi:hypothetical protein